MSRHANASIVKRIARRPVRIAAAVKIALLFLAADAGFTAAKAFLLKTPASPAATVAAAGPRVLPVIVSIDANEKQDCRLVAVKIDDGYGVQGEVNRMVCRKAL